VASTIKAGDLIRTKSGAFGTVLSLETQDDDSTIANVELDDDPTPGSTRFNSEDLELMPDT
jgi:hypothetical protein